ncbi:MULTISPECIES: TolC family protein [Cycloclasticus]|uniref:RND efflux system outer membrane lipoprotein n=1 Tax=Cycloclasticus pugetii TaxID=34068 RepID=A0AB33Z2T5_9GAMM|nr:MULTISPECIES: TolC family protein [Cycloclasticus]ATI02927.1 TolC family protein [Cycloclasticus sp. PY97N]EPD13679.1 RND efflux system outer membrane lipoprotein [Cycloclasticus pugetii]
MNRVIQSLGLFAISLVLNACANLGNKQLSESALNTTGQMVTWQAQDATAEDASQLTDLVDIEAIPNLTNFIQEALNNNANLQQTLVTLRTAQVAIDVVEADQNVNLSAGNSASKAKNENSGYSNNLNISWELDLWQKISNGVSAANFQAASAEAAYQSARDSLVANVLREYINILSQQQLLNIERARLTVFKNNETVILNRYRTGLGSLDDLDTARTSSATIQATLAQYEYNLATARRTLAVLLGRQDQSLTELDQTSSFPDVLLPLANLPKQNLSRRPDLQAAYYTLKASEFEVDVAYKALLPSINLSAALSDSASSATDALFTNPLWSLLGQMTAPLFQGGALRAQVEIEKLASVNAWWLYQESLLNAVQETQTALDNERALTERKKYTSMAIDNAERSVKTIEGQYRQGLANILDLVSVYNSRFDLQSQLIQLQASQLQNRINLGLALGLGVPYEK